MEILKKIKILGNAGKWDQVCGSRKLFRSDGNLKNAVAGSIYQSVGHCGKTVSLYKTLMTNECKFDCKYCQNSNLGCKSKRTEFKPEELAKVFNYIYKEGYAEALFLSSGISDNPDLVAEKMVEAVKLVREKYCFEGYIHLKVLPGQNRDLIKQACQYADRLSINLETPNSSRLSYFSHIKDYKIDILRRQAWIKHERPLAGQTTQLIVGDSSGTDFEVLKMVNWEYDNMDVERVFFSRFMPVEKTPLENDKATPLSRQNRLYNVDYMLRKYNIKLKEFRPIMNDGNLPHGDPKVHLANNYFDGPIDINEASQEELLRIPGIGPVAAKNINFYLSRGRKFMKRVELKQVGVILKRAEPFLKIGGSCQRTLECY